MMICFNPKGTACRFNSLSDPEAQRDRMAPSGRVCKGDERSIIPSSSKCDGDDVEQAPLGLMTREHGILGKIVENNRKVLRIFKAKNEHKEAPNYELTPRELEILKHLTQGLSYKMISDVCHISFETTRSHIKNVYNKLQVASMTEAVIKAINEKIV